jgi:predicted dehydrogenase
MQTKVRMAMVGCGGMARHHLKKIAQQLDTTHIAALCDPNPAMFEQAGKLFEKAGLDMPPTWQSLEKMLTDAGDQLDAAFIITPHAYHHDQTVACLEAGLDVLLEKPMAVNAREAQSLIEARDRTGRLLVVAFQGSLSPQVRMGEKLLRSGELGQILNISAVVWQNWKAMTTNTWRQNPALSGGGFMFDTGAHVLNTVSDLAGEDFVEVAAWFDNRNTEVDILAAAIGRLQSGALVTLNGCGDTIKSCFSDIRVFCTEGILQTTMWGDYLNVQRAGRKKLRPIKVPDSMGVWQQFLAVRDGTLANPCPPEIGLRMVQLWDALQESARQGGRPVVGNGAFRS